MPCGSVLPGMVGRIPAGRVAPSPVGVVVLPVDGLGVGVGELDADGLAEMVTAPDAGAGAVALLDLAVADSVACLPAAVPDGTFTFACSSSELPLAIPPTAQLRPLADGQTVNVGVAELPATLPLIVTLTALAAPPDGQTQIAYLAESPGCRLDLVEIGCTSRQSCGFALVAVGVGVGVGLADPEPELGEGVGVGSDVELALAEAELVGLTAAELALDDAVGVAVALVLLLALALLLPLALLLALMFGVALLVDLLVDLLLALAVAFGVLAGSNAASRVTVICPAGSMRAALAAAGGEPHWLGAAAAVTAASAGLAVPSRPPAIPDDTMAAPATAPSAVVADRADFMAVLS